MNALFKGLLSVLTGGVSDIFTNGGFSNLGKILSNAGDTANDLGNQNILGNYVAGKTGSRLTDAQREANAWTAEREDIAWNRQLQASNTAYQRQVEDLKSAGLNPMLATGNGVSLPSASISGSVSPGQSGSIVGDIIQLMQAKGQLAVLHADKELKEAEAKKALADARKSESEKTGIDILNNYRAESEELRLEGNRLSNDLSREDRDRIREQKNLLIKQQDLVSKQADTEVERKNALVAKRILDNASATQIAALLPYHQVLMSAEAGRERAAAELSLANAAMQIGLIDSGYIEQQLRNLDAEATEKEIENVGKAFEVGMRTGQMPEGYEYLLNDVDAWSVKNILAPVRNVGESFGPLVGLLFKPTVRSKSTISK